jgi:Xaa-Pro aminopeptidase
MDRHGLDAIVATTPENVYYLSGSGTEHSFHFAIQGMTCAILPADERIPATLIVQSWELPDQIFNPTWMPQLRLQNNIDFYVSPTYPMTETDEKLRRLLSEAKEDLPNRQRILGRTLVELGLDKANVAFDDLRVMLELTENETPDIKGVDGLNVLREIRVIKTPDEVAIMRQANRMIQVALEGMGALCVEGGTVREVLRYYKSVMALHGGYGSHAVGGGVDRPWIAFPNEEYRFKSGDMVYVDPAGHFKHYWGDLGRTALVGTPLPEFEERYGILQEMHRICVPMLQPGTSTAAIKEEARRIAGDSGLPVEGLAPLTHSIGIDQYDHVQPVGDFLYADFELEDGMMINFETLYFEVGWGMLQLEDTFHLNAGEVTRLATLPQEPFRDGVISGAGAEHDGHPQTIPAA